MKSGNYDLCHQQNDEAACDELVEATFAAGDQGELLNFQFMISITSIQDLSLDLETIFGNDLRVTYLLKA